MWLIVEKMEITAILFKWVSLIIKLIIFGKEGPLLLFQDSLDITRFHNGKFVKLHGLKIMLWYYLSHIASIIKLSKFWCEYGFFITVHPIIFQYKHQYNLSKIIVFVIAYT